MSRQEKVETVIAVLVILYFGRLAVLHGVWVLGSVLGK